MHDIPSNIHFPTLFKCRIYGKQKFAALEFIKALTTSWFIQLDIFLNLPFTPDDIHQILTSLLPCQFTIKHINIQWCLDPDRGINLNDSGYISGITLAPLLEFSHLENFELSTLSLLHGIDTLFYGLKVLFIMKISILYHTITNDGKIWLHDGMTTGRNAVMEGNMQNITSSYLTQCNGKVVALAIYAQN
jgi:hypothetical protein